MRKMDIIPDKLFALRYQQIFDNVFEYNQAFKEFWFSPNITHRLILYPLNFEFNDSQMRAVQKAMSTVGDDAFIITIIELLEGKGKKHWIIPVEDIEAYSSIGMKKTLENTIYSPNGKWGVKFTMDNNAIVGGTKKFIEVLKEVWPDPIDDQISVFLSDFKHDYQHSNANISWLKQFLKHICGTEVGNKLLTLVTDE